MRKVFDRAGVAAVTLAVVGFAFGALAATPIVALPTPIDNTTSAVYTNGAVSSEIAAGKWAAWSNETEIVIYKTAEGYYFDSNGTTVKTNTLDTTKNPATTAGPFAAVASVTMSGETKVYGTIAEAWAAAKEGTEPATVKLFKDVATDATLETTLAKVMTLDLNGRTLEQTGNARIINVQGKLTVENGVLTRSGSAYSENGAGIYVYRNEDNENDLSQLVMRGVTMTNCVTTKDGGAIYAAKDTQVMLENCTLRQNAASGIGGAIGTEGGQTNDGTSPKGPWDKLVLISTVITDNTAGSNGAGVYYKHTVKGGSCFVAGTKVLMADGSEKVIEEVEDGDVVRTFDHEGGTNSTARVFLTVKEQIATRVFVLAFADGYSVRCVLSHDFLVKDGDCCEYACLNRQNAADYVGKGFYAADGKWHELLSVTDGETVNEVYEIYTVQHLNSYADGMLTVPADVAHVLNIYKLDTNLKADAKQLAADVAAYGLAEFDEMATKYGMSREYYDAFGVKYGYVIVGKGLATLSQIEALYRSAQEDVVSAQPKKAFLNQTLASNESDPLENYGTSCLTIEAGTIVTNNLVGTNPNNIYIDFVKENDLSLIALANDRAGICAGVTLDPKCFTDAEPYGRFTTYSCANPGDVALFSSDSANYAVWYKNEGSGSYLKLAAGSQIVPPAVANTTYEIWKDGEILAVNEGTTVEINTVVKVVYHADDGYVFADGVPTKEVSVDTSKSVATMTPPAEPFVPVASVTTNDVTTVYGTLVGAWADATNAQHKSVNAHVALLADATVDTTLRTSDSGALTLDLNDHVLAYVGMNDESIVHLWSGTLHVVDTAQTRTPRYFTCNATGLWTLTNEETDLVACGGLLTGGRKGAITYEFAKGGSHTISNVNVVGNCSASSGGAVRTPSAGYTLKIVESSFFGNIASTNGGAISAAGPCEMTDCRVSANVAGGLGGGLYLANGSSLVRTEVVGNKAGTGGGVYLTYNRSGCFPAGVKILMADGSEKAVETIVEGDVVATFDHIGGTSSSAEVFYVYRGTGAQDTFTLSFASGAKLAVADRHDLLSEATRKYVTVSSDNARQFIGKRFYNYATGSWDELTGVTDAKDCDVCYSIYTRGHANCVANGMLTVADDKDFYLNVYELDENLKADAEQLATDIKTYGLATPDDYPNIPLDDFEASNMRYARIAIGKGLVTQEAILYWNEFDYGPIVEEEALSKPKLAALAATPSVPYLSVGEGTVVTGNVTTAGDVSNVYLDRSKSAIIDIKSGTENLDIGVTLSSGVGVFGFENVVNYAAKFTSDDPQYTVIYNAANELELVLPVAYVEPVYVTAGAPASGIAYWTTNEVYNYTVVESSESAVIWGEAGVTNWYVVKNGTYQIDGGVVCQGYVNLILCEGAKLVVNSTDKAGIATDSSGCLFTIYGQPDGAGALTVTGGNYCAGIGSGFSGSGSRTTINGGEVTANGGFGGAGIGGGSAGNGDGITVNGGTVSAVGGKNAAGIGGGASGAGRNITINGGTVTAIGSSEGAGIGGGLGGVGQDILIGSEAKVFVCGMGGRYMGSDNYPNIIGNGGECMSTAEDIVISRSAQVCFNLTGLYDEDKQTYIEEMVPMPEDFSGLTILTSDPMTEGRDRVLASGLDDLLVAAMPEFNLAKSGQERTKPIVINIDKVPFAGMMLQLIYLDNKLTLSVAGELPEQPIVRDKKGKDLNVVLPEEWCTTNGVQKEDAVDTENPMDNGMPAWQNYVLGINPTNLYSGIYADSPQNAEEGTVTVETKNLDEQKLVNGFSVKYRLDTKLKGESEYEKGETQESSTFAVKVDGADPTGVYKLNAVIYSNGVEVAQSAESVNTVGLIKQTQAMTNAIVSVPWNRLAPGEKLDIAVSNVVKTANLSEGDELRVYRPGASTYDGWRLNADKVWEPMVKVAMPKQGKAMLGVAEPPEGATIPRGSGIWLCRKAEEAGKPYYLYGQANGDDSSEVVLEKGPNLVGATGLDDYDLNEHVTDAAAGDQIIVPTAGTPILYEWRDGLWGTYKSITTNIIFQGQSYPAIKNVWTTDESKVGAGIGFWLHNRSGNVKVK